MQFNKDETGKLEKAVNYIVNKYRPDLKDVSFLCVWREEEKIEDGGLVLGEVAKLSNKNRDVFGYDVMLEVDRAAWDDSDKEEKKKLIFHELQHVKIETEADDKNNEDLPHENKTAQELFEERLEDSNAIKGEFKYDKQGRLKIKIRPHSLSVNRFNEELLIFGLSEEEEALRLFLNHVHDTVGMTGNIKKNKVEVKITSKNHDDDDE